MANPQARVEHGRQGCGPMPPRVMKRLRTPRKSTANNSSPFYKYPFTKRPELCPASNYYIHPNVYTYEHSSKSCHACLIETWIPIADKARTESSSESLIAFTRRRLALHPTNSSRVNAFQALTNLDSQTKPSGPRRTSSSFATPSTNFHIPNLSTQSRPRYIPG